MSFVEIILTCLFLLNILAIFIIRRKIKITNNVSDEYQTSLSALLFMVQTYKSSKYILEIDKLRTKFDTDPTSPTKALQPFKTECDKILAESVKSIIKLISKNLMNSLGNYYSLEGLLFIIMEELKK